MSDLNWSNFPFVKVFQYMIGQYGDGNATSGDPMFTTDLRVSIIYEQT